MGEVKALLLEGKDPVTDRRVTRAANAASADNTFQAVAQGWLAMKKKEWSDAHYHCCPVKTRIDSAGCWWGCCRNWGRRPELAFFFRIAEGEVTSAAGCSR